jgi:hypothetical protein
MITAEWRPLPNRKNDVIMMEALTETEEFTATELKEINRCRIYLRVFTYHTLLLVMGKESHTGQEKDGEMQE